MLFIYKVLMITETRQKEPDTAAVRLGKVLR